MTDPDFDRIEHDAAGSRYVLRRGERELGFVEYEQAPGMLTFVHTEIDPDVQERGLGTKLVAGALDDVRTSGGLPVRRDVPVRAPVPQGPPGVRGSDDSLTSIRTLPR